MRNKVVAMIGAVALAGTAMGQANLLTNPSFEQDDPNFLTGPLGWSTFNQGSQPSTLFARTGTRSLELKYRVNDDFVGTWNNFFDPDLLVFPYAPNTLYKAAPIVASAWYLIPAATPVTGGTTFASLKVEIFRTANGSIYQGFEWPGSIPATTNGQWAQVTRTINPSDFGSFELEPAVGASTRTTFMMLMFDGAVTPGKTATIYWDDVSLVQNTQPTCYADCDASGGLSPADFTCFLNKYRAGGSAADCDNSGGLSPADFTCFLGKYRAGCP